MGEIYAESIPSHCPPEEAFEPRRLEVFRLLEEAVPTTIDFQSHPVRWPEQFGDRRDCNAWSLSVFTSRIGVNRILGLRAHRHKKVARLVLLPVSLVGWEGFWTATQQIRWQGL